MALRDMARGLLGGAQRFAQGANGLLFPGLGAGVDPEIARRAQSQAMLMTGMGLLGGNDIGGAYKTGMIAGTQPLEEMRRQKLLEIEQSQQKAMEDWRKWQQQQAEQAAARQEKLDYRDFKDRNRAAVRERVRDMEADERWRLQFGLQQASAARAAEAAAIQQQAAQAALERQAQEDALRQRVIEGTYADPGKSRGGGPGQRRTGGITDPLEQLIVQSGDVRDLATLRNPPKDRDKQRVELQLAGDFAAQSKEFNTVAQQYRRMLELAQNPSAANDFALIYAQAKINDPTSAVRESEFASSAAVGSYGSKVQAAMARIANGQMLTPEQRADFLTSAGNQYNAMRGQWEQTVVAPTRQRAENYGLDWNNIYRPYALPEQQQVFDDKPPATKNRGRVIEDDKGNRWRSDGMTWKPL